MKVRVCCIICIVLLFLFGNNSSAYGQEKLIKEGDDWQYFDGDKAPNENWMTSNASSEHWKNGISPLGYGDEIIKTEVGFGGNPDKKHITKYFKKTFRLENPFEFLMYQINVQRDDGIVVYLNGYEIWRNNMPQGKITDTTSAANLVFNNKLEQVYLSKVLSPDDFVYGVNTISASVHQARGASSDCLFNLELVGNNDPELLPLLLKERSMKNIELNAKVQELNYKLDIEKKDLQLEFVQQTKDDLKTWLYIIGGLLILSLIGLGNLYLGFKKRFKLNVKEIVQLKESVASRDQEMMGISLNTLNSQQYLKELKKDIEKSASGDAASIKKKLSKLTSQLEFHLEQDDDWDNLKKHFNAVHTGFFDRLLQQYSSLTESELRHCVFIKLHMQTKEIARILHIDPRSVQASRYRIKKKMNLDENVDLKQYLQSF